MSDLTRGEYLAAACAYLRGLNSPCRTPEEGERAAGLLETLERQLARAVSALTRAATDLDSCRSQLSAATARASELETKLEKAEVTVCDIFGALHNPFISDDVRLTRLVSFLPLTGAQLDTGVALVAQRDTELAAMGERVTRAELQLKALDLLCGYTSEEDGTVVFRVLDTGERHCQVQLIPARGDDAGRAALALAIKLRLIAPEGKGETNG